MQKPHGLRLISERLGANLEGAVAALCRHLAISIVLVAQVGVAHAAGGRILATGGVTQIEGAGGGGIAPWALIAGYGTRNEAGGNGFATYVDTGDFNLKSYGGAVGLYDRLELSFARHDLDVSGTIPNTSIKQDVIGAKLKLFGDAVFDQDRWWPQVALGVQVKHNLDFDFVPKLIGAQDASGVDVYLAATKVYLGLLAGRNVIVNAVVRATRANQFGLLGFGGDRHDGYQPEFEGSAGVFITDALVVGAELRTRPDNLRAFEENDIYDFFVAYVPTKHVAVTAAYANLGRIADHEGQGAFYISGQLSF